MTSSIFDDRTALGAWAPSTQATASTMLDLPLPLGPTTTVTPGSNVSVIGSANDLKPLSVSDLRNIYQCPRYESTPSFSPASERIVMAVLRGSIDATPTF